MEMRIRDIWKTNKVFRIISISISALLIIIGSLFLYRNIFKNPLSFSNQTKETNVIKIDKNDCATTNIDGIVNNLDLTEPPQNSIAVFINQNSKNYLNSNLGPSGKEVIPPEPGEIGTWDIPIPLINPLGSENLYSEISHYDQRGYDLQYISNYTEYEKTLNGENWILSVNNDSGLPIQYLKEYAINLGAEIFSSAYSDSLVLRLNKDDAVWWCEARENPYGYEFVVLKQKMYAPGKEYTLSKDFLSNIRDGEVAFCTENKGEKFQTLYIKLPSGKIRIKALNTINYGDSTAYYRYDISLDSETSDTFILDNLPQIEGVYDWYFEFSQEDAPSSLSFLIEESYDIPKVKDGNELGALLVKGVPFGSVYVQPQKYVTLDFREANQRKLYGSENIEGSLTPEGDTLFVLAPGLYTIINRAPYMNYGSTRTQLVPVSSGEQTVATLPESLKSANARLNSMADDSELTGGIEVNEAKDLTTTAEISISVSDPLERDINPTKENTIIYEGLTKAEVTDIRRIVAPCSVALVLDSSGSMKGDMKGALNAAKLFLQTLPEGSFVKVIDFDTEVKVLKGETPAEAIKALSEITSGGYTKLYDATLKGVETVMGKTRPAVVVFTDGRDSSHDNTGGGSSHSKGAVIDKIKESKIPVYTIGYGKRLNSEQAESGVKVDGVPDIQCLLEFASAANGQYYPAKNPEALPGVFAAISSKLGNNFVITYKRPTEHNISETPFVSIVVDNSGSMNSDPSEGVDCDYRMEKTISLFHDFLEKLPPKIMMQLTTFQTPAMSPPLIVQQQITTDQKANILKAIGEMEAHGGTPVVEALRTAYENIIVVPSSRKAIVFLTDGGLEVEPEQLQQYNKLLEKIKEKNISILFIGMGTHSKEKLFADAAIVTGGDYVISEDIEEIKIKLNQLLSTLKETTPPDSIPISISLKLNTSDGDELNYSIADEVEFSPPKKAGPSIEPDLIKIVTGSPYHRYDNISAFVTGLGIPGIDNVITNRVTFDKKLSNKAMELTVKNADYLSLFQGIEAQRYGKQFIALEVELENKTQDKIPYAIPSLFNHFYIGVNQEGLYPTNKATWLSDKPLAVFGNPEIVINPGEKKSGIIVFIVPNSQAVSQLSLHFYDTNYGHIQLPLSGKISDKWLEIDKLPTSAFGALSDTFNMQLIGKSVKSKIEQYQANEYSTFRIVEAKFESKVQALLNLDPKERFWLRIDTKSGALMSKMSDTTAALPLGFLEPTMLGPASNNIVRMAYDLPYQMGKYKSDIYVDLATGSKELPVSTGEIYGAPNPVTTQKGPGIMVTVNQLASVDNGVPLITNNQINNNGFQDTVILDVTFTDLPGNEGTMIPDDFFALVNNNYRAPSGRVTAGRVGIGGGEESEGNLINPEGYTQELIFGVDPSFGVFEGQSRRGIIVFRKPDGSIGDWTLQSPYMENIRVPILKEPFKSPELLGYKAEVQVYKEFEDLLEKAISASISRYTALQDETSKTVNIVLNGGDGLQNVPMPSISTYGLMQLDQISNEQQVIRLLQALKCLPVNRNEGYLLSYGYQPEAVLTQGWGEIGDLTNLALRLLSRLGYSPKVRALSLTEAGKKALLDFSGINPERTIPLGISYKNNIGEHKTLVVPFMMDLTELEGFVYFQVEAKDDDTKYNQEYAVIEVSVRYEPGAGDGTVSGTTGEISGVLGGDEGGSTTQQLLMLETELSLAELSLDAIDLCFMPTSNTGASKGYYALLSTPKGVIAGQTVLDNPARVLGVEIAINQISEVNKNLLHYSTLGEGESLDKFFQTIAINLPDLTEEAAAFLDEKARQVHASADNPDPISIAKWYGRNAIYQFISGNSMFDNQMVSRLGLVLGRISRPRCLILTSHLDKSDQMHTTIDLLQPWNEIHGGEEDAIKAYDLLSGFYMSDLEGKVLPGNNKVNYLELWTQAPSGATIQVIPVMEFDRNEILTQMKEQEKYPLLLLKAVEENNNLILAPTKPTIFMGQERWAWLEIDPDTYKALSVFDTGLHSAMAEFKLSMLPSEDDTVKWLKGIWVGTNVSVWTMCSSSLKYGDDYKAVLSDAKKTAEEVEKVVSEFFELEGNLKDMKFGKDFDLGNSHKIEFEISMTGIKGSVGQKMYSFSGGMKLAIDAYFKSIVPQPATPGPKKPK